MEVTAAPGTMPPTMVGAPPVVYVMAPPTAVSTVPVSSTVRYRDIPMKVQCEHCNSVTTTVLRYKTGLFTWAVAGGICVIGFWCGCCLVPFALNECKDVEHECGLGGSCKVPRLEEAVQSEGLLTPELLHPWLGNKSKV
ncbi:hypothetical protein Pelo_15550 [Pelomyxa schiedti]|nr:hypothetical protein Pelo_15550 [Pelomyxa schiedti]